MDVRINREIRDYSEKILLGLTLRETVFSALAIAASGVVYFLLKGIMHVEFVSWVCVAVALPFVFIGFFKYHELPAEQIIYRILIDTAGSKYLTYSSVGMIEKSKRKGKENEIKDSKGYVSRKERKKKRF